MSDQLIPPVLLEQVAKRFKTLCEPIRLQLINQMQVQGEMNVNELVDAIKQSQANVSKHLNLMAREGILSRRKEGLKVYYRIADPTIREICTLVCSRLRQEAAAHQRLLEEL